MRHTNRKGFSLVELAVVVIIIGVLAAFGVPRFRDAVERSKASEAFSFLSAIRSAQERYQARQGQYAKSLGSLDISMSPPAYFRDVAGNNLGNTTAIVVDTTPKNSKWSLTMMRDPLTSSYGNYTVVFTDKGIDTATSTIVSDTDLNARINPLAQ